MSYNRGLMLGDADVPYKAADGKSGTGHATAAANCGSSFATQQMLNDLGYPVGAVDGQIGNATFKALKNFTAASGVSYTPGSFPSGAVCDALSAAWNAKNAPPPPPPAASPAAPTKLSLLIAQMQKKGVKLPSTLTPPPLAEASKGDVLGWWGDQSMAARVAMGAGALALLGGIAYFIASSGGSQRATPNLRRKKRRGKVKRRVIETRTSGTPSACSCQSMVPNYRRAPRKAKRRAKAKLPKTCRVKRPRGYPADRSKYGLPECMMYPLATKKDVRAAASRFGKYKGRYSAPVRTKIAHRIDAAKRRFGIGQYQR